LLLDNFWWRSRTECKLDII